MRHHVPTRRPVRRPVVVRADDKVGRKADDEQGEEPPEEAEPARDRVAGALAVVIIFGVVALIWRRSLVVLMPAAVWRGWTGGRGRPGEVEDAGLGIVVVDGRFRLFGACVAGHVDLDALVDAVVLASAHLEDPLLLRVDVALLGGNEV